jgi:transcriptional regulator GlxA family with amidase domain
VRSNTFYPTLTKAALIAALLLTGCGTELHDARQAAADDTSTAEIHPAFQRLKPPVDLPGDRPLQVGFLIVDGVYNTELTAPYDIFHHVRFHTKPGMDVFTVSPDGQPVRTFEGLRIEADHSFQTAPAIDVLVVPSAEHSMDTDLDNQELIHWVRKTGERALFFVSLCDGAFVLAAAGLLEGHSCTTFPGDQDSFSEMFPSLDLHRGVSFVHDGKALTSQGGAKSFDVAMYLADHLYGEKVAQGLGRGMVIPWPPTASTMSTLVVHAEEVPGR